MRIALWEVFLEGFCVALVVGVVAVGVLVLVFLARDVSAVDVLVLVALASVVLAVGAAVVGVWPIIAAVVLNGPVVAGVLVAVPVPAVVVVVVVGVVLAGVVAAASVLFWVCESGVVSQGWVGEVVEGWSGVWVDGALRGAGWGGWGVWVGVEAVAVFKEGEGFGEAVLEVFAVGRSGRRVLGWCGRVRGRGGFVRL